jgi:energy-coupling factor transporter transmembrane protein EcfT
MYQSCDGEDAMRIWLHSWWEQIKQHLVTILIVAIILVVAIVLIIIGYGLDWTGFNGNNKSGKTLWDWLQLLFIPAVLTLGAIWYTARQNHDLQITLDNQRETALQTYLDKMSELLLHENLRTSKRGDDVRNIAHARTLTVLPQLDPNRKRYNGPRNLDTESG